MAIRGRNVFVLIIICSIASSIGLRADHPCPCPQGTSCGYERVGQPYCFDDTPCSCVDLGCLNGLKVTNWSFFRFASDPPNDIIDCFSVGCAGFCFALGWQACGRVLFCVPTGSFGFCFTNSQCSGNLSLQTWNVYGYWASYPEPCCYLYQ